MKRVKRQIVMPVAIIMMFTVLASNVYAAGDYAEDNSEVQNADSQVYTISDIDHTYQASITEMPDHWVDASDSTVTFLEEGNPFNRVTYFFDNSTTEEVVLLNAHSYYDTDHKVTDDGLDDPGSFTLEDGTEVFMAGYHYLYGGDEYTKSMTGYVQVSDDSMYGTYLCVKIQRVTTDPDNFVPVSEEEMREAWSRVTLTENDSEYTGSYEDDAYYNDDEYYEDADQDTGLFHIREQDDKYDIELVIDSPDGLSGHARENSAWFSDDFYITDVTYEIFAQYIIDQEIYADQYRYQNKLWSVYDPDEEDNEDDVITYEEYPNSDLYKTSLPDGREATWFTTTYEDPANEAYIYIPLDEESFIRIFISRFDEEGEHIVDEEEVLYYYGLIREINLIPAEESDPDFMVGYKEDFVEPIERPPYCFTSSENNECSAVITARPAGTAVASVYEDAANFFSMTVSPAARTVEYDFLQMTVDEYEQEYLPQALVNPDWMDVFYNSAAIEIDEESGEELYDASQGVFQTGDLSDDYSGVWAAMTCHYKGLDGSGAAFHDYYANTASACLDLENGWLLSVIVSDITDAETFSVPYTEESLRTLFECVDITVA